MIYKDFCRTGRKVSAVGFGGMRFDLKKSEPANAELLLYAYDKGINYFDTAPDYCQDRSEAIFGLALKQMSDVREDIFVSSKGMPTALPTASQARKAVEKSLRRLNLEKLDIYYVWCIRKIEHYELAMKKGGQYEGLMKCKEEGLIDHIFVSTHLPGNKISTILADDNFDGVLMGVNILNFPYRWEGLQKAQEMGLTVVAMNPLGGGVIARHSDKLGFLGQGRETPVEAALRFCISCPGITVALNGFSTKEHIDVACRVADSCKPYSSKDIDRIKRHTAKNMDALCTGCGYCLSGCPQKIPIAAYMLYYNGKILAGGKNEKEMIDNIDFEHRWGALADRVAEAGDCVECGQCQEDCTQHLNIMERLREIADWYRKANK
jgi:predicted aldo/keto reductase-like oxidoreductase